MRHQRLKRVLLVLGGFLSCVTPVLAVLWGRWEMYAQNTCRGTVRSGIGVGLICYWTLRSVLHVGRRMSVLRLAACGLLLSVLLSPPADDIPLLFGAFLLGRCICFLFFETALRRMEKRRGRAGKLDVGDGEEKMGETE